ncbi:little elongation complex subunit 1-like [Porphyrio hochstetteri]
MMPGETPPPAGTAAAAAVCANCGVLQQNINEYVATLIALKQKMIDGDRLLTEYQQKCTDILYFSISVLTELVYQHFLQGGLRLLFKA